MEMKSFVRILRGDEAPAADAVESSARDWSYLQVEGEVRRGLLSHDLPLDDPPSKAAGKSKYQKDFSNYSSSGGGGRSHFS